MIAPVDSKKRKLAHEVRHTGTHLESQFFRVEEDKKVFNCLRCNKKIINENGFSKLYNHVKSHKNWLDTINDSEVGHCVEVRTYPLSEKVKTINSHLKFIIDNNQSLFPVNCG